ncbi:YesL family protein [Jeotgalibacillus proteolyticus]|uniref:YesL family protein n=1 Tax=Jeotgalibacillus proteolyticus TaxID=2082395 RepID=UPI003CEEC627
MQMGGMLGSVHQSASWITKGASLNFLWFLCNAPLFFILADYWANGGELALGLGVPIALVPLLFFPSTAALFAIVRKWVLKEEETVLSFFQYFKDNFIQSLIGGVFFTIVWTGWLAQAGSLPQVVIVIISSWLMAWMFFFFTFQVHFSVNVLHTIKNAVIMTAMRPLSVVMIAAMAGTLFYISSIYTFLLPFCSAVVLAYIAFSLFYRFYQVRLTQQTEFVKEENMESAGHTRPISKLDMAISKASE